MGYPYLRGLALLASEGIIYTNLLPELFILPRLDDSARYVKRVTAIPHKPGIVSRMRQQRIPGTLPSRWRGLSSCGLTLYAV